MKVFLIAALSLALGGCLIVPEVPHYRDQFPSRENMDRPVDEKFPPVGTTRDQVLLRLGAPDVALGDKRLVYRWRKVVAEVSVMNSSSAVVKGYVLEVEFDERGTVTACRQK
jgi:hypothetical protein